MKSLARCSRCSKTTKDPNAPCWKLEPPLCGKCNYTLHPTKYNRKIAGTGGTYVKPARSTLVSVICGESFDSTTTPKTI